MLGIFVDMALNGIRRNNKIEKRKRNREYARKYRIVSFFGIVKIVRGVISVMMFVGRWTFKKETSCKREEGSDCSYGREIPSSSLFVNN
jgi:hypothetical protein